MVPRVRQVMRQTNARISAGDTHAANKIVSLFEPSTEVIRKGEAGKPLSAGSTEADCLHRFDRRSCFPQQNGGTI